MNGIVETAELAASKSLTSLQRAFIKLLSDGVDDSLAVTAAGYKTDQPGVVAWELTRQPAIMAAVHLEMARKLAMGAPVALKTLRELMGNGDARIRLAAAKTWLDRAGHIAPKAIAATKGAEKPLNEMSTAELRELADKLENEIAGRAKPVSSTNPAPHAAQAIEDII